MDAVIVAEQLGPYEILRQLTKSGATDLLLGRTSGLQGFQRHVVIKRVPATYARDDKFRNAFLAEARVAASLHHHNIVQVYAVGESAGDLYFAMEYVHGADLRKLLVELRARRTPLPFAQAIAIGSAIAAGLHHVHESRGPDGKIAGLLHRDVSPANVLIGYDGSVKLTDFGLATVVLRSVDTMPMSLDHKASYMSPEQICGQPVDRRSDLFALGVVLFEMLTARRLYKGTNAFETMTSIVKADPPRPSTYREDIPQELEDIVLRALARDPEARHQSAEELRSALERYALVTSLRISSKSLADYMFSVFGHQPEPWLVETKPMVVADFDKTGVARSGNAAQPDLETTQRAPIIAARQLAVDPTGEVPEIDLAPTKISEPLDFDTEGATIVETDWKQRNADFEATTNVVDREPVGDVTATTTVISPEPRRDDLAPTEPVPKQPRRDEQVTTDVVPVRAPAPPALPAPIAPLAPQIVAPRPPAVVPAPDIPRFPTSELILDAEPVVSLSPDRRRFYVSAVAIAILLIVAIVTALR